MKKYLRLAVMAAGLTLVAGSALAADLKFGLAASLTGPGAQYGASIRNGFELAVEEINNAGGVKGNKIVAVIDDDQGKKEEGINTFKKLIFQDNVLAIFGPTFSNVAVAADAIAQASRVVAFGTSTTADGITATGEFIFRNAVTEADVLPETIRVAAQKVGLKKVAVFYGSDDVLTKSGYDNFKKALDDLKVPVTTTETFAKGDVDFKAQLTKIAATKPDAIVLSALIAEGAPIMVQARQLGINVPFIGGNGMNSVKIFELANEKAENLWVGSPWSFENASEENKQFIAKYKKKFGGNAPDQFAAQAYDALFIVCEAAKKVNFSGSVAVDRVAIRNALPSVTWKGATGAFRFKQAFDRTGKPAGFDAEQRAIVSVTRQGRFVLQN